uniref:DDE_3 domain-containing protein n=1 Tax=Strongyloides venezuelensis TaxID=75913 RepID=A0A0K0EUR3_STRVS
MTGKQDSSILTLLNSCRSCSKVTTGESGENLENERKPESVLDNDVLRKVVEANSRTTVRSRYDICSSLILRNNNDSFLGLNRREPILLHDNLESHTSKRTVQKLRESGYEILLHSAYSPDLSLTDYCFFKLLNNILSEKIFRNDEEAKTVFKAFIESGSPDF